MKQIILNTQRMTSLEIAELTGKPHNDVLKAIRKMEPAWEKVNEGNFSLVEYRDKKGEIRPCYSLTKTETLYIATKFNDEARARLVLRWEELEMERMAKIQQATVCRLLPTASEVMHAAEEIVSQQLECLNGASDHCVTTTDIAKLYNMDTCDLISYLRDMEILRPKGRQRLTPQYEGKGLTEMRHVIYYSLKGEQKTQAYLVWTMKGRQMIMDLIGN